MVLSQNILTRVIAKKVVPKEDAQQGDIDVGVILFAVFLRRLAEAEAHRDPDLWPRGHGGQVVGTQLRLILKSVRILSSGKEPEHRGETDQGYS